MNVASGLDSGPLVLFNGKQDAVVIAPFGEFMASSVQYDLQAGTATWGVIGNASTIPAGFHTTTIIYHSDSGIRQVTLIYKLLHLKSIYKL